MNLKKLGVLAVILILLGLYFYFYEVPVERERKEAKENDKKAIVFKPEAVEELRLKIEGKTVLFSKDKGQWMIKEPIVAKGEDETIGKALNSLAKAEIERTVNESPVSLVEYGLDKPSIEITIKEKNKPPLETILLGNKNPTDYYVYTKREKSKAVMLTSSGLKEQLNQEIYYYRDKTVIDFKVEDIKNLRLKYEDKKADLRLDDKKDWQIVKPIKAKADGGSIRRLLYSLKNSRIKGFVEETSKDLKRYGLDSPEMEIVFFSDKNHPAKSLLIGERVKGEKDFYAKWEDAKNVFLLPESSLKDYPKTEFDLRDKTVFDFEKEKIFRVALKYPYEEISLENDAKNQWNITKPIIAKADEFEVSDLLWALLDIRAKGFINDGPKAHETYGLNKPVIEINLWEKGGKNPFQLIIARKGKNLFAKTNIKDTVCQLPPDVLKALTKTPFSLRDKTLLTFKNEDVKKIRLNSPDKTFILKLDKGDWQAIKPVETILNKVGVISFLWDIKLLKFKEIISEGMKEDPSIYGFNKPKTEITLWDNKENKIGSIIIGKKVQNKDMLYAKVDFAPTIYGIEPQFLEKLPHDISDLK
ncbi:MAG: DUF4340 domain-containing protein [Deltaproteobacteria bacterium]|nr:MAG: DUF4340 domain-containing protein [Deltaproteobacteria bacterium]